MSRRKISVRTLGSMAQSGERIVALTAYDYQTAKMEEAAGIHVILVGDSFQMAVLGEETTLGASMDVLVTHCRAVKRQPPQPLWWETCPSAATSRRTRSQLGTQCAS